MRVTKKNQQQNGHREIVDAVKALCSEKDIEPEVLFSAIEEAMKAAGIAQPTHSPIRGGTDGAQLSFMGLPCPNLFTGGMNFHGKFEYCSLTTMHKTEQVILNLAQLWAE